MKNFQRPSRKADIAPFVLTVLLVASTGCVPMMIMKSLDRDHYSEYVQATNKLNTEREQAGLTPVEVMTFEEWRGTKK